MSFFKKLCYWKLEFKLNFYFYNFYRRWKWDVKWSEVKSLSQSCPTLCDSMDCSLLGSFVQGNFQAIVLEWIAISFFKGSSQLRDRTQVSCILDRRFTVWATRGATFINTLIPFMRNLPLKSNYFPKPGIPSSSGVRNWHSKFGETQIFRP